MPDDIAIKVEEINKTFKLPHERKGTLKNVFLNIFRGKTTYEKQDALKDISFEIKKGEFFGIVGRNGSGKSTLLKLMAGIYSPDKGHVQVNGKLVPFIELGVGFNPELTGRENVFLNGALLGFDRKQMIAMYDEIVEFAELNRFMDQSLKNYSSGMQVRLAFSIAIKAQAEVLLLDEVLAVGDEAFQKKCYDYFADLKSQKKTVVLVTHDMSAVERFCTKAALINNGAMIKTGSPYDIADEYRRLNLESINDFASRRNKNLTQKNIKRMDADAQITKVWTSEGYKGKQVTVFRPKQKIYIHCYITAKKDIYNPRIVLRFNNPGSPTLAYVSTIDKKLKIKLTSNKKIKLTWELPGIYNDGRYLITAVIADSKTREIYDKAQDAYEFSVYGWTMPDVMTHPEDKLKVTKV